MDSRHHNGLFGIVAYRRKNPMMRKLRFLLLVGLIVCLGCTHQNIETVQTGDQNVEVFPQLGHSSWVNSVAFDPNGKYVLSGSNEGTLVLWDVDTEREIRRFNGHRPSTIYSVSFSPDGKFILSASGDRTLKLWDITTDEAIKTFEGHTRGVTSAVFTPDGKYILSGSNDMTLKLWDITKDEAIKTFEGHYREVRSVAISPDGKYAVSGSYYGIKLWDIATGKELNRNFEGHTALVEFITFGPDGKYILSASDVNPKTITLWDTFTGKELKTFQSKIYKSKVVAASPGGTYILAASDDENLTLWDVATGQEVRIIGDGYPIDSVAFSHNGKYALLGDRYGFISLWDIITGKEVRIYGGYNDGFGSTTISSDGNYSFSGFDRGVILWDIAIGKIVKRFYGHNGRDVTAVTVSPDEKHIISGSRDNTIRLWDVATGQEIGKFEGHKNWIRAIAITPDGKYLFSGSNYEGLKLWNMTTRQEIRTIGNPARNITSIAITPDGKYVFSGSYTDFMDRESTYTLEQWDIATGQEIRTFKNHTGLVTSIDISSDGKYILSSSWDKTIRLWDVSTGEEIRIIEDEMSAHSAVFSPDGEYILSTSGNTFKLRDIATGQLIKTFEGHTNTVDYVIFCPNKKQILSVSKDETIRLWDIASGNEIVSFLSFTDDEWIAITPDGYYNASPKGDKYLNVRIGNEVFGIDQFAAAFYQPEVVQARLQGKKDPPVVKLRGDIRTATAPPKVDIAVINQNELGDTAELAVSISDQFKQIGKTDIEITVNGRLLGKNELQAVTAPKNIKVGNTRLSASSQDHELDFTIPVKLDSGFNIIEIIAANDFSYGLRRVTLNAPETEMPPRGDLRILAIGVNKYMNDSSFNLNFPASDADKIINSFMSQGDAGKPYNQVHILNISENEPINKPTKRAILSGLDFLKQARPNDTIVLFLSGHGKTENGLYYFLPSDTIFTGRGGFKPESTVNIEELVSALNIPGRKILLLDTCDSGGADTNNRLVRTLKNRSTVVFAASQDGEKAWENRIYGGYFAHSIAEGIGGKVAGVGNEVQIVPLGEYISNRVMELNKETGTQPQHPMKYIPDGYQNFVISMAGGRK